MTKNWCTSKEIAEFLGVEHVTAKTYVDVLRGKNFVMWNQTNEVKRIDENYDIVVEYVINYPLNMMTALIKQELGV